MSIKTRLEKLERRKSGGNSAPHVVIIQEATDERPPFFWIDGQEVSERPEAGGHDHVFLSVGNVDMRTDI